MPQQRAHQDTGQTGHGQTELQPRSCRQMTFSLVRTALSSDPGDGGIKNPKSFDRVPCVCLGRRKRSLNKGLAELSSLPPLGRPGGTLCTEFRRHTTPSPNLVVASSGHPAWLAETSLLEAIPSSLIGPLKAAAPRTESSYPMVSTANSCHPPSD